MDLIKMRTANFKIKKHNCLNGGLCIKLPDEIKNKKACINFENKDEYCFIYSIRLSIDVHYKKTLNHSKRVKQYEKYLNDPIFSGYEFSMS